MQEALIVPNFRHLVLCSASTSECLYLLLYLFTSKFLATEVLKYSYVRQLKELNE